MTTYGSFGGVRAYVRYMQFDQPNHPTTDDVNTWLAGRSAQLTGWLAAAGYATPVTQAEAKAALDRFANVGAAGDAELSMRAAGANPDADDVRENTFLREFAKAEAWINSGALLGLGVPQATTENLIAPEAMGGVITKTAPIMAPTCSPFDANARRYRGDPYLP